MKKIVITLLLSFWCACGSHPKANKEQPATKAVLPATMTRVTFIELGSVNCIPCKMMQKVTAALEQKFPADLKIIFYDVYADSGKMQVEHFGIRSIPTQVFLDASGKEFFRHEGFFPQEEIEKILAEHAVTK